MENTKDKPLCLRIEDAEKEIASVINRHITECGVPCYILEPIVRNLYSQVVSRKAAELEIIRKDYEDTKKEKAVKEEG